MKNKRRQTKWAFVKPEIIRGNYILRPVYYLQVYVVETLDGRKTICVSSDYNKAKKALIKVGLKRK